MQPALFQINLTYGVSALPQRFAGKAALTSALVSRIPAALELAQLNLAHATVRSPVAGYVTHLRLRPGDYATAGETKVAIIDAHSF